MLLVKKLNSFLYLFSVKIRLEIRFNNVLDRKKKNLFSHKNSIFQSPKKLHFSKGVNPRFWSKNVMFSLVRFSVKIKLEMMFNNVLYRNETSFGHTKFNLSKSQKLHFSKGVNPCFWLFFFLYLFSVKIILQIMFNNVLDKKETFFGRKKCNISKSPKYHFSKRVNQCFWSEMYIFFFICFRSK